MNREELWNTAKRDLIGLVERFAKETADTPDWDIHTPAFFAAGETTVPGKDLLVQPFLIAADSKDEELRGFRELLEEIGLPIGGIMGGGYKLDLDTRERIGETIFLHLEDDEGRQMYCSWDLTRHEGAPPTLSEKPEILDGHRGTSNRIDGRMANFFPEPVAPTVLN